MFNCVDVEGTRYLAADTSILCSGSRYASFVPLGITGIVLYPVAVPLFFLVLLLRFRHQRRSPAVLPWLGFLFASFSDSMSYFELVDMVEKLLLTSVLVFFQSLAVQM